MEDRHAILLTAAILLGPKLQEYPVPWKADQIPGNDGSGLES
jgi:hypothetical protein